MQTLYKFLGIILLSIAIFSGCNENTSETSPVSSDQGSLLKSSGPSASGQGRIEGTNRTFSFNAVTHHDGSVSGQGQLTLTHNGNDIKIHFSVDCLTVTGNAAILQGTVAKIIGYPEYSGVPFWFKVVDNGEGSNSNPDEMTFFYFCEPETECDLPECGGELDVDLYAIENGNIQVKL